MSDTERTLTIINNQIRMTNSSSKKQSNKEASGPSTPHPGLTSPPYSPITPIGSSIVQDSASPISTIIDDPYEPPKKQTKKWTHQRTITRTQSPPKSVSFGEQSQSSQAISNVNPDPNKFNQLVFQKILSKITLDNGEVVTSIRGVHARSQTNAVPSFKNFGLTDVFNFTNSYGEVFKGV